MIISTDILNQHNTSLANLPDAFKEALTWKNWRGLSGIDPVNTTDTRVNSQLHKLKLLVQMLNNMNANKFEVNNFGIGKTASLKM